MALDTPSIGYPFDAKFEHFSFCFVYFIHHLPFYLCIFKTQKKCVINVQVSEFVVLCCVVLCCCVVLLVFDSYPSRSQNPTCVCASEYERVSVYTRMRTCTRGLQPVSPNNLTPTPTPTPVLTLKLRFLRTEKRGIRWKARHSLSLHRPRTLTVSRPCSGCRPSCCPHLRCMCRVGSGRVRGSGAVG